ncbi:MAG TPA: hypothetical protein VGG19_15885 [Tepidisphaeraceae bacterium]|jgi:hypothetical protein
MQRELISLFNRKVAKSAKKNANLVFLLCALRAFAVKKSFGGLLGRTA